MGNINRPSGPQDDTFPEDPHKKTPFDRFFEATHAWRQNINPRQAAETMEQYALDAMKMAMKEGKFLEATNIYQWLQHVCPQFLESSPPSFHLDYLQALKGKGEPPETTLREGEAIFQTFIRNIPHLEKKYNALLCGLAEASKDEPGNEEFQERIKTEEQRVYGQWIFFFEHVQRIVKEMLEIAYEAQGQDVLSELNRWTHNFAELLRWFSRVTKPLRETQRIEALAAFYKLDIDLRVRQLRLGYRQWFYEKEPGARRRAAIGLHGTAEIFKDDLRKLIAPPPPQDQSLLETSEYKEKLRLAAMLKKNKKNLLAKFEADRVIAALFAHAYEYGGMPEVSGEKEEEIGILEMRDESLAVLSIYQSERAKRWVNEAITLCEKAMEEGERLETQEFDPETKRELNFELMRIANRLNENLPKVGRFKDGYEWYEKAMARAQGEENERFKASVMNDFAWQNLFVLAKRLIMDPTEDLQEQAEFLRERLALEAGDPQSLLEKALEIAEEAREIVEQRDPSGSHFIKDTVMELCLALLEISGIPDDTRREWVLKAWNILFQIFENKSRPDLKEPQPFFWSHTGLYAFVKTLAFGAELGETFQLNLLGISKEAFWNGFQALKQDLQSKQRHRAIYPENYLRGLEEKVMRCAIFAKREEPAPPTPPPLRLR